MTTTSISEELNNNAFNEELNNNTFEKPGQQLARLREQSFGHLEKPLEAADVAKRLNLRVRMIELLEADAYDKMPQPVFIKGYIRAYAKLLGVPADPLVEKFNALCTTERKLEKALWQGRRETNRNEWFVRLLTGFITLGAIIAIGVWWEKNKDSQPLFSVKGKGVVTKMVSNEPDAEIRLTDLSKMRPMLNSSENSEVSPLGNEGG